MTEFLRKWLLDPPLVIAVTLLSLFGIAMIYSAGVLNVPSLVTGIWVKQLTWFGVSLVAFTVVSRVPLRWLEWVAIPTYVIALILLAATLVIGVGRGTAESTKSWIALGGFAFQPAELAKIATILVLARHLSNREEPPDSIRSLVTPAFLVGIPLGLVILQPDLGTALAFIGILFATLYWVGTPVGILLLLASPVAGLILSFDSKVWAGYFVILILLLYLYRYRIFFVEAVAVVLANLAAGTVAQPLWNSLEGYQRNRFLVFLDPSVDPKGAGYHLIQSRIAVGSGGLTGKGFTEGTQKRLDFLPEQHTDFIFSVIGEELGFVGTVGVIAVFGYVLWRMVRLAEDAADPFAGLVIFGILGAWLVHIFVNIGMTIGVVPITGIPLPFISYGGTFLLMSWIAVALMVRAAHEE